MKCKLKSCVCFLTCIFLISCSNQANTYDWYFKKINLSILRNAKQEQVIKIGLLDSGLDKDYYQFFNDDTFINEYNFLNNDNDCSSKLNNHATNISMLIAAPYTKYVCGVDDRLKIVPIQIIDDLGICKLENVLKGIDYAISQGCQIINMSFGTNSYSDELEAKIKENSNVYFVASCGDNNADEIMYPALYDDVYAVTAIDINGNIYEYSNKSKTKKTYHVPGVDLTVPVIFDNQINKTYISGSSYATALFTGMIASLLCSNKLNKNALDSYDIYTNNFIDCNKLLKVS